MSGSLAELWGVRHRLSLLAPGRGEVLVYLSPEVGCFLQPCFNACEAFWSHDEIDVEFLDHQFGQYDVSANIFNAEKAKDADGNTIPDTFDFELNSDVSAELFDLPSDLMIDARIHMPTGTVRYMFCFSTPDELWQMALEGRKEAPAPEKKPTPSADTQLQFQLMPHAEETTLPPLPIPTIRTSPGLTVHKLCKYIAKKLEVMTSQLDITVLNGNQVVSVPKDLTLEAVQMGLWQNPGTLVLNYRLAS